MRENATVGEHESPYEGRRIELLAKRLLDIVVASGALVVSSPLFAYMAVAIPRYLGKGGVFFTQKRPGLMEEPIEVVKFRSMLEKYDDQGRELTDTERLVEFGRVMRKFSLDEFPQFLSVVRGDMSVVGPRPLLTEYLERYPNEYRRRHWVKPGITGWAQINGRHEATFSQRLQLDTFYVDNWSIWLDLKIIALTPFRVFLQSHVHMPDQPIEDVDDLDLTGRGTETTADTKESDSDG